MRQRLVRWLSGSRLPAWLALLGALLALPAVFCGLTADDHHFRMVLQGFPGLPELRLDPLDLYTFADGDVLRNAAAMERGLLPWWAPPDFKLAFWRPLAASTHALDQALWPDSAVAAHVHSLVWYAWLCFALTGLYRRTFARAWVAGLAALIFVVHDAHVASAGWIASRNTIMSCLAAVLALSAHDRWRRQGWRPGAAVGPLCLALGLLCAEATLGALGYLTAHAAFIDRAPPRRRIAALAPYALVTVVWAIVHHTLAYGARGSGLYLDPAGEPLVFAAALMRRLPLATLSQITGIDPVLWMVAPAPWPTVLVWSALILAALAAWTLWPLARRDPWVPFWAVGFVLALVPTCAAFPQKRMLFLPGLGGMALVALLIEAWFTGRPALRRGIARRAVTRGLVALSIGVHMIAGPLTALPGTLTAPVTERLMLLAAQGFPADAAIADQRVVIVSLPADLLLHGIPYTRSSLRWPSPRHLQALYAGLGSVEIHRSDPRTLDVRAEDSFTSRLLSQMFRGTESYPFTKGDTVRLEGLNIEITDVDERDRAIAARFRFDEPLEAAADHWLTWSRQGLVPFELPPVGATVRLPEVGLRTFLRHNLFDFFATGAWRRMGLVETGPLQPWR